MNAFAAFADTAEMRSLDRELAELETFHANTIDDFMDRQYRVHNATPSATAPGELSGRWGMKRSA